MFDINACGVRFLVGAVHGEVCIKCNALLKPLKATTKHNERDLQTRAKYKPAWKGHCVVYVVIKALR